MLAAKQVVILANSIREKKRCVAGKELFPKGNGKYEIGPWIRFTDPKDPHGAVSVASTIGAFVGGIRPVRPLDIIEATFTGRAGNLDHPEDWFFDATRRWHIVDNLGYEKLSELQDTPQSLWNTVEKRNSVPAGYVSRMEGAPASLYLIKAPKVWDVLFWNGQIPDESNPGQTKAKQKRVLIFRFAGCSHEFSVTDADFNARRRIFERMTEKYQTVAVRDSTNVFFCLSLTPEFKGRHYKVAATIFEPA